MTSLQISITVLQIKSKKIDRGLRGKRGGGAERCYTTTATPAVWKQCPAGVAEWVVVMVECFRIGLVEG